MEECGARLNRENEKLPRGAGREQRGLIADLKSQRLADSLA